MFLTAVLRADTHLTVVVGEGTEVVSGNLDSTFASPASPGEIVRKFKIRGNNPTLRASAVVRGAGMIAETHGQYPAEKKSAVRSNETVMAPLPAPIEVEGTVVDHGVEVRP